MNTLQAEFSRRNWLLAMSGAAVASAVATRAAGKGDAFPDLTQFQLEGSVPDLKGKVALVDFWASWCGPCKKSFPVLKELHEKFAARGALVVAVSLDEDKKDMDGYLKKNPVPFIVLRDPKSKLAEKLGVEAMPSSFIVGADGRIRSMHLGFEGEATRKLYMQEMEAALASK